MTLLSKITDQVSTLDAEIRRMMVIAFSIVLLFFVCYGLLENHLSNLQRKLVSRELTLKELMPLQQRYREISGESQRLTNHLATVTTDDSPAAIIEQSGIVAKAGIQTKPLPKQEKNGSLEDSSEITLSGLSLNETVNLLHRLEYGTKPVAIRKALLRTRFSDPAKLDLTLTVGLLRPAPTERR